MLSTVFVSTFTWSDDFRLPCVFCLLAHALDGVHHVFLLREKRVTEVGRPLDVFGQKLDGVGQGSQTLDAGVPVLLLYRFGHLLLIHALVLGQPLLQLNDLERIGGRYQYLAEQRIGVESDWRYQRIELVGRKKWPRLDQRAPASARLPPGCLLVSDHRCKGSL